MSRILNGTQEPKLRLAHELARVLGVSLDYLVDESLEGEPGSQTVTVTDDELTILKVVRRLGVGVSIDRLLGVSIPMARSELASKPETRRGKGRGRRTGE